MVDVRQPLSKGALLDEKYVIDTVIGAGGFGVTYRAFDRGLQIPVAIKEFFPAQFGVRSVSNSIVPNSATARDMFDRLRASFLKEAQIIARFDHPAIVKVLSVFEANATAYMVMAFEDGENLKSSIRSGRRFSQAEIDALTAPLLDALELLHNHDYLHRDVAPDNVILRPDSSPVLIDFGASRHVAVDMTRTITGVVKEGYSPIEQYSTERRQQGPWTDIYALAATLYAAVTGRAPVDATTRSIQDTNPRATASAGYRNSFLEAIDAGMAVQPSQRPQSIAAWRAMLLPAVETTAPPREAREEATVIAPSAATYRRHFGAARGIRIALVASVALVSLGWLGFDLVQRWRIADRGSAAQGVAAGGSAASMALQAATAAGTEVAMEQFLGIYGGSPEARAARSRLADLRAKRREGEEVKAWEAAQRSEDVSALRQFLAQHADGAFRDPAHKRLAFLMEQEAARQRDAAERDKAEDEATWRAAAEAGSEASLIGYLVSRPSGHFVVAARRRLDEVRQRAEEQEAARQKLAADLAARVVVERQAAEARVLADEAAAQAALAHETAAELVRLGCLRPGDDTGWAASLAPALQHFNRVTARGVATDRAQPETVKILRATAADVCDVQSADERLELGARILSELVRIGCLDGAKSSSWGTHATEAIRRFNEKTARAVRVDRPTRTALAALSQGTQRICSDAPKVARTAVKTPIAAKAPRAKARQETPPPKRLARVETACRLETKFECINRICPTRNCGLRGSGVCLPERRRRVC